MALHSSTVPRHPDSLPDQHIGKELIQRIDKWRRKIAGTYWVFDTICVVVSPLCFAACCPVTGEGNQGRATHGASINDILKMFGIFDPLPPYPHLELVCSI